MSDPRPFNQAESRGPRSALLPAWLLACVMLIAVFVGLLQVDVPLDRYLRSVHVYWLERTGDLGYLLGSGAVLLAISGTMVLVGWMLAWTRARLAGLQSLIAHAVAALIAQIIKHMVGRPRPRLVHGDNGVLFGPSLESGLDSFPSGHTTASFAVATVLAKRFPQAGWLIYAIAGFVAMSRIVRGSHFPTDVMAGVVIGMLVGSLVADPIHVWKDSLSRVVTNLAQYMAICFGFLWIAVHRVSTQSFSLWMVLSGIAIIAAGIGLRLSRSFRNGVVKARGRFEVVLLNGLIALGLSLTTGSAFMAALTCMMLVLWLSDQRTTGIPTGIAVVSDAQPISIWRKGLWLEMPILLGVVALLMAIQMLKGLLPIM